MIASIRAGSSTAVTPKGGHGHSAVADTLLSPEGPLLRLRRLTPLALVLIAACSDTKHPREVVGTWAQDSLYGGGIVRGTDTFRLMSNGIALHSGGIATTDAAANPLKPTVWAEGLKWSYRPRAGGPLLCLFVEEGQEADCHTIRIASESLLVVDGRSYWRLRGR